MNEDLLKNSGDFFKNTGMDGMTYAPTNQPTDKRGVFLKPKGTYNGYVNTHVLGSMDQDFRDKEAEILEPEFVAFQAKKYSLPSYVGEYTTLVGMYRVMRDSYWAADIDVDVAVSRVMRLAAFEASKPYGFPFYVVSEELMDAVMHTDLPDSWTAQDLTMGFEAITFVLPVHEHYFSKPEYVPFMTTAVNVTTDLRNRMERNYSHSGRHMQMHTGGATDGFAVVSSLMDLKGWTTKDDVYRTGMHTRYCSREENLSNLEEAEDEEDKLTNELWALTTKLVHLLNFRGKDLITEPRARTTRKKGVTTEVWSPRMLGAKYNRMTVSAGASGSDDDESSVRLHCRRGHYRRQHFGKKNGMVKTIWIEPCWVGKEKK